MGIAYCRPAGCNLVFTGQIFHPPEKSLSNRRKSVVTPAHAEIQGICQGEGKERQPSGAEERKKALFLDRYKVVSFLIKLSGHLEKIFIRR
ncbi:MAG: hypothetical protein PVJ68_11015 [Candidatus Thiodiazotropha sp.]